MKIRYAIVLAAELQRVMRGRVKLQRAPHDTLRAIARYEHVKGEASRVLGVLCELLARQRRCSFQCAQQFYATREQNFVDERRDDDEAALADVTRRADAKRGHAKVDANANHVRRQEQQSFENLSANRCNI